MGTLATVLAGKDIQTPPDMYRADIAGTIEDVDGVLKITRIEVHYCLTCPDDQQADVKTALKDYIVKCPAAQSVIGCIAITDRITFK